MSDEKHDRAGSVTGPQSQLQETSVAAPRNVVTPPMTGAERAKAFRRRRRDRFRSIRLDVHDSELDAMVRHGLLPAEQRTDAAAIYTALGKLLDRAVAALEAGRLPK